MRATTEEILDDHRQLIDQLGKRDPHGLRQHDVGECPDAAEPEASSRVALPDRDGRDRGPENLGHIGTVQERNSQNARRERVELYSRRHRQSEIYPDNVDIDGNGAKELRVQEGQDPHGQPIRPAHESDQKTGHDRDKIRAHRDLDTQDQPFREERELVQDHVPIQMVFHGCDIAFSRPATRSETQKTMLTNMTTTAEKASKGAK